MAPPSRPHSSHAVTNVTTSATGVQTIASALGGEVRGPALVAIERTEAGDGPAAVSAADALFTRLHLLKGIGSWREAQLRAAGYHTLHDLCRHSRLGEEAARCLAALQSREIGPLTQFRQRGAPTAELLGLFAPHELVFLDIETMGLGFGQEVFLVGLLAWREGGQHAGEGAGAWRLRQLLLTELTAQRELLAASIEDLRSSRACLTYNGATFDLPFLRAALRLSGFEEDAAAALDALFHADLLYPMRRRYGGLLPDCRLTTVAAHVLGVLRDDDDLPGAAIPLMFEVFLQSGDVGILARILEHNRQDLLALRDLTLHELTTHSLHAQPVSAHTLHATRPGGQ